MAGVDIRDRDRVPGRLDAGLAVEADQASGLVTTGDGGHDDDGRIEPAHHVGEQLVH
ncbi:MAG: hypothetical protein ACRD0G_19255 [Acidimicrobiales bacterium]